MAHGKVLIINDEPRIRDHIEKWLKGIGYSYYFVDIDDAYEDLRDYAEFDAILYGHEFLFKKNFHLKFPVIN